MRSLLCKLFGHLDVIHGYSTNTGGFIHMKQTHYHCEACGRLRNSTTMVCTPRVQRWKPATSARMVGVAVGGNAMTCKHCNKTVHTDEQEQVEDQFTFDICLCLKCAEQAHGEEEYMRSHSYDVATPFAENH